MWAEAAVAVVAASLTNSIFKPPWVRLSQGFDDMVRVALLRLGPEACSCWWFSS